MTHPLASLLREGIDALKAYTVPPVPPPVKLDANESPWPLPEDARRVLADALARIDLHRYPDARASGFREALASRYGGDPDEYVIGCGSDELIALLYLAFARPRAPGQPVTVVYPEPTFVMYGLSARTHGLVPVGVPLDATWNVDVPAMKAAFEAHAPHLVFYATPNNPTGNAYRTEAIEALVQAAPNALHVVDEAYAVFAGRPQQHLFGTYENVALLGTLSKIGVAAARLGWARLPKALAREVDKVRQPFNVNALAQEAGRLALTTLAPVLDAQVASIVDERARLGRELARVPGLVVHPSDANFFLVGVEGDAKALARALLGHGVGVRAFTGYGPRLDDQLRITVGTPAENDRLLEALAVERPR